MKARFYIVCKQAKGQEWADQNNTLTTTKAKAQAKKEAKEWAASLRQTVSVWRLTVEVEGSGENMHIFPEWIGQAESPVYLRDMEQTPADICGNWAE